MKRIVYSIFTSKLEKHPSANDFKKNQFLKYKKNIIKAQETYAKTCDAYYKLFETKLNNYNDIQFQKLYLFEELANEYDEILYLDFDVIPIKNTVIFDKFNLNTLCACTIDKVKDTLIELRTIEYMDEMNMFIKTTSKNAMLAIHDINGKNDLINTGVLLSNSNLIKSIKLSDKINEADKTFKVACEDNLYYEEITKHWIKNNEAYLSYIVERYNIPFTNIGILWNYIMNHKIKDKNPSAYFLHVISKEFEKCLE